jgi:epoxyqueuosine reductase QueG
LSIARRTILTASDSSLGNRIQPRPKRDIGSPVFPKLRYSITGSIWSERHIAFAAGLGTFSLNDAMITEKGIAVKLLSAVTNLKLEPDVRKAKSHTENCLYLSKGTCGACIQRCPVGAISKEGHDKMKCYAYVYGEESKQAAAAIGASAKAGSGCGLCQSNVPCENKNPCRLV